jgi:hypothetical protein
VLLVSQESFAKEQRERFIHKNTRRELTLTLADTVHVPQHLVSDLQQYTILSNNQAELHYQLTDNSGNLLQVLTGTWRTLVGYNTPEEMTITNCQQYWTRALAGEPESCLQMYRASLKVSLRKTGYRALTTA